MNKRIAIPTTILAFLSLGLVFMHQQFHATTYEPFHVHGQLTDSTKNIFEKLHQKIATLKEANLYAQTNFIRKPGTERWHEQEETELHKYMKENRSALIENFKELGMIDEIQPKQKKYVYAGLLGALKERFEYRLNYLNELITAGYQFKYIVLLGGQRPLQPIEKENLPEDITTELEMMTYLFNKSSLKDSNVIIVDAPMVQKPDGTWTRPITDGTLVYFAKIAPEDGSLLMISNNPYVLRQTKVAQRIFDQQRFPVDGAGKAADAEEMNIVMTFDEFARTLYEEHTQFSAASAA
jgi:hypothetical protein